MNENTLLFATNVFVFILCGGLLILIPRLTRNSYLFGVKIPPEEQDCPEARQIKKQYMFTSLLGAGIGIILCTIQFIMWQDITFIATLYLPLLIIPIFFAAFIPNWKKAVRLKEKRGWKVSNALFADTSSFNTNRNLSTLPWQWYAAGLVVILATVIVAVVQFPYIPDRIPVHLGANMEPTRWADKSWGSVLMMPLINAAMLAVMFLAALVIEKGRLQIDPDNPRLSFAQHRIYRRRMGNALGFMSLALNIFLAPLGMAMLFPDSSFWNTQIILWLSIIMICIAPLSIIGVFIKTGQGGCKVKIDLDDIDSGENSKTPKMSGRGDDRYWLLGMFYYNPDDPALLVEMRFGSKFSFNYARPLAKIVTMLFIIAFIVLYVWLTIFITTA